MEWVCLASLPSPIRWTTLPRRPASPTPSPSLGRAGPNPSTTSSSKLFNCKQTQAKYSSFKILILFCCRNVVCQFLSSIETRVLVACPILRVSLFIQGLRFWYFRIQMGFGGGEIEDMILGMGNGQGRI